jgi:hypothetical protein
MNDKLDARIDSMFNMDRLFALIILAVLWATIAFVYFYVDNLVADGPIQTVLTIGAALLLIFNTASIVAMLRHYAQDKHFIYDIDIRHLDQIKANKR